MSSESTATESAAAQSIAGQPQSTDDLKVKQDGGVEQVKEGEQKEGGDKTVFDDAGNFNVKHPLFSQWTLYFSSPHVKNVPKTPSTAAAPAGQASGWMEDMRKVAKFDSVEEFWGLHNNIVPPSTLGQKADYYLFKEDIIPAWEDSANKNGGKWSVQLPKEKTKATIDQMWLYTMLAAIGETYETDAGSKDMGEPSDDLVTGVIVNVRPAFFRLNIWTRQAPTDPNEPSPLLERILKIGRHFKKDVLGYELDAKLMQSGYSTEVEFINHKDGEKKLKAKKIVLN